MGTIYLTDGDDLTSVANAIRAKSGGSGQLAFPAGFVSEIGAIPSGGSDWTEFTAAAAAANAQDCMTMLFPNREAGKRHFAYLINKSEGDYINYQLLCVAHLGIGTLGGGVRRKDGANNSFSQLTASASAKIAIGDTYMVCENMSMD